MPFEPRLFHGDCDPRPLGIDCMIESDAELGLPPELTALASQLRSEASALAERYPAAPPAEFHHDGIETVRRRVIWGGIAAAALLGALLGWRTFAAPQHPAPPDNSAVAQANSQIVAPADDASGHVAATATSNVSRPAPVASVDPAAIRPTQGIGEVSVVPAAETARKPPTDEVAMLRVQVDGFEKLIRRLQAELAARDAQQADAQRQIESLREEVRELHKQLSEATHTSLKR